MDELIIDEGRVDNFEGPPVSPSEMGIQIQETDMGGGENIASSDLKTELGKIFNPDFSVFGHGAGLKVAPEILDQGLTADQNDLFSTTTPIFDTSRTYNDQADQVLATINNWPHRNSKAIVIVMVPNPGEGEVGGKRYFNSVFEELPKSEVEQGVRYLIPLNYIKGYIDVETQKFIPNPKFKPEKPIIKDNVQLSEVPSPAIASLTPVEIPGVSKSEDQLPDVW